ncbi:hypothetical protein F7R91_15810 [Streptomyces luteolifulvus]|uniref:Uncharacterized protein n=1 Tax=Streptomyces luteolifulvus TaxID=2615112 RepID=A0A6H9V1H0_9ACTN|nr:hypothetical protein F7R91_15810 [Streptomyces luteolifulvus]
MSRPPLTLTETEMLRNLNREFRGNGLPYERYSKLVRRSVLRGGRRCRSRGSTPRSRRLTRPRRR